MSQVNQNPGQTVHLANAAVRRSWGESSARREQQAGPPVCRRGCERECGKSAKPHGVSPAPALGRALLRQSWLEQGLRRTPGVETPKWRPSFRPAHHEKRCHGFESVSGARVRPLAWMQLFYDQASPVSRSGGHRVTSHKSVPQGQGGPSSTYVLKRACKVAERALCAPAPMHGAPALSFAPTPLRASAVSR